jgi:hypothetical protein
VETNIDPKWGEWNPLHDPCILAHFKTRPTDILITTAPKAGTTWMQQILYQLKTGGDDSFVSIDQVAPWLELPRNNQSWQQSLACFEQLPNPRIFKTHCTYMQTPGVDTARIILSSRDPRDCCVSFYHHVMSMTDAALKYFNMTRPQSFAEYFESWMSFGAWYRNVQSWWPHINAANVLWLRYQDMVTDLPTAVQQILTFLDWELDESKAEKILEYCSFSWMKQHAEKFVARSEAGESLFKPGGFIRKGQVGDHNSLMSPKQEQQILDRAKAILPEDCLSFIGIR